MTLKAFSIRHLPTGKWLVDPKFKDELTAADIRDIRDPLVFSEAEAIERISTLKHPDDWEIVKQSDIGEKREWTVTDALKLLDKALQFPPDWDKTPDEKP